jgi:hypothetical protein
MRSPRYIDSGLSSFSPAKSVAERPELISKLKTMNEQIFSAAFRFKIATTIYYHGN